jgi:phage shock protein A
MSDISFFSRVGNLFKGFMSLWIQDVEKEHPEIAYQNRIDSMTAKYAKLKDVTAAVLRRREDIDGRLNKQGEELKRVNADLEAAVSTNQDDLALVLIQKKEALDSSIASLSIEFEQSRRDAEEAKSSLNSLKGEISKLKDERDTMLAKLQSAQARIQIQDQLEGMSVEADVRALDNVREHINNTAARAKLGAELADSDLDNKLAKLRETSGAISARATLDKLKAAQAAKAAGSKTL